MLVRTTLLQRLVVTNNRRHFSASNAERIDIHPVRAQALDGARLVVLPDAFNSESVGGMHGPMIPAHFPVHQPHLPAYTANLISTETIRQTRLISGVISKCSTWGARDEGWLSQMEVVSRELGRDVTCMWDVLGLVSRCWRGLGLSSVTLPSSATVFSVMRHLCLVID